MMTPKPQPPVTVRLERAKRKRIGDDALTLDQLAGTIVALVLIVGLAACVVGQLATAIVHWTN